MDGVSVRQARSRCLDANLDRHIDGRESGRRRYDRLDSENQLARRWRGEDYVGGGGTSGQQGRSCALRSVMRSVCMRQHNSRTAVSACRSDTS